MFCYNRQLDDDYFCSFVEYLYNIIGEIYQKMIVSNVQTLKMYITLYKFPSKTHEQFIKGFIFPHTQLDGSSF